MKDTQPLKADNEIRTQSNTSSHATTADSGDGRMEFEPNRQEVDQPVEEDDTLPLSGVVVCISRKLVSEEGT